MKKRKILIAGILLTMPTIVMPTLVDDFERDLLGRWQAECFAVYNTFNNTVLGHTNNNASSNNDNAVKSSN